MLELEIRDIAVDCIIGDLPHEREKPQRVTVDVALVIDETAAGTDAIEDTVDYVALAERIRETLVVARCRMLERAAKLACDAAASFPHVRRASAAVTKTGAIPGLASATARYSTART